jgi:hypothetical protein
MGSVSPVCCLRFVIPLAAVAIGGIVPAPSANNVKVGPFLTRQDWPAFGHDGVAANMRTSEPVRFQCSPKTEALIVDRLRL